MKTRFVFVDRDQARARIEARARAMADKEQTEYERKVAAREQREGRAKGCEIEKPDPTPKPKDQDNLTDTDSRPMRHNKSSPFEQAFNAQASVDADGSQLVLSTHTTQCASDRNEPVIGTLASRNSDHKVRQTVSPLSNFPQAAYPYPKRRAILAGLSKSARPRLLDETYFFCALAGLATPCTLLLVTVPGLPSDEEFTDAHLMYAEREAAD